MKHRVTINLIGYTGRSCFHELTEWLCHDERCQVASEYERIAEAIDYGVGQQSKPELTLVLQSWPQEFLTSDIDRLLGATIMSSLLCCYGPWCESDGRSSPHWPGSVRVPSRWAVATIQQQVDYLLGGGPALSPLAAPEEAFAVRIGPSGSNTTRWQQRNPSSLIVSHDAAFRRTAVACCRRLAGGSASGVNSLNESNPTSDNPLRRSPDLILIDLDDDYRSMNRLLEFAASKFPDATRIGVTWNVSLLAGDHGIHSLHRIIAKLDLNSGFTSAINMPEV